MNSDQPDNLLSELGRIFQGLIVVIQKNHFLYAQNISRRPLLLPAYF